MSYFKNGSLIEMLTTTATAGGTTTLTAASRSYQQFTGTLAQTVVLPDATTLPVGRLFSVLNRSTGIITINKNGGALLTLVIADFQREIRLVDNSTAAGVWDVSTGSTASGSGGSKNYITNGTFDADTSGWATYADAAGASPVDGTGGSPNVTIARSTTTPLSGAGSSLLTKDAANRQGQGWSYDFTIDRSDLAKVLNIGFDYLINSGTFVAGAAGTVNSDVTVWIYDVTNAVLIQPSNIKLFSNNGTIPDRFQAQFQTAPNSTSYRLILHVASTSASAYELKADNFLVGPSDYIFGTPITDWKTVVVTGSWTTNTTYTAQRRRVGDEYEYSVYVALTGAPNNANLAITLPTGDVIDTAKIPSAAATFLEPVGRAQFLDSGALIYEGSVILLNTTNVIIDPLVTNATYASLAGTGNVAPFTFGNTDAVAIRFRVPIVGLSSSVQTSDNADTRVCAARYKSGTSQGFTSTPTIFDYGSSEFDTHGAVTVGSAWKFTAPVAGYYRVSHANHFGNATWTAGSTWNSFLYKNGAVYCELYTNENETSIQANRQVQGSTSVYLNAGDFIDVRLTHTSTGTESTNNDSSQNYIDIERMTGPSAIAASELVAAVYNGTVTGTIGAAANAVTFPTKVIDTHGGMSGSTYTVPVAGLYEVQCQLFISGTQSAGFAIASLIYVNGTEKALGIFRWAAAATNSSTTFASALLRLNAGDTIQGRSYSDGSSNSFNTGSAHYNYLAIKRIGL